MTVVILPKGFDTIIPIEQINFYPNKTNKKYILIDQKIKKHNHVRFAGSDFKKGEVILKKNNIFHPTHILAYKNLYIKILIEYLCQTFVVKFDIIIIVFFKIIESIME